MRFKFREVNLYYLVKIGLRIFINFGITAKVFSHMICFNGYSLQPCAGSAA